MGNCEPVPIIFIAQKNKRAKANWKQLHYTGNTTSALSKQMHRHHAKLAKYLE